MPPRLVKQRLKQRRLTFIRQWRVKRGLSLDALVSRIGEDELTASSLSRIERGLQPYTQDLMEACADALDCSVADILARRPGAAQSEAVTLVENMSDDLKETALRVLKALVRGERAA